MNTKHRHIRIEEIPWQAAQRRAAREGTTISALVREFVVAYGSGQLTRGWKPVDTEEDSE